MILLDDSRLGRIERYARHRREPRVEPKETLAMVDEIRRLREKMRLLEEAAGVAWVAAQLDGDPAKGLRTVVDAAIACKMDSGL